FSIMLMNEEVPINLSSFIRHRDTNIRSAHLLTPEELPQPGTLVAIDAEFVALNQEETEIRSDGTKSVIRPRRLSLARVSVLRGEGARENLPFIDDYIAASEPVVDYLTEFSGIQAGDLDQQSSKHTLVPLKAYILVPSNQVIDTVDIFHIKNRARYDNIMFILSSSLKSSNRSISFPRAGKYHLDFWL
ncbi:4741_t:CDS:2, partial [Acaulospora morrowiae]